MLRPEFDNMPAELRDRPRWVLWRLEWDADREKHTKVPYRADGRGKASSTNSDTWTTFDAARAAYERGTQKADGVGWVIGDGIAGVDIDACRDLTKLTTEAAAAVAELNTYTEVSPSGTGVRAFAFGTLPSGRRKRGPFEMYDGDHGRYLTVTGHRLPATPATVNERTAALATVHARHLAEPPRAPSKQPEKRSAPAGKGVHLSDAEVIERMTRKKPDAARLWAGDLSDYTDPETGKPDHSRADAGLAAYLAWWTDYNEAQVHRLMATWCCYRAEKWARVGADTLTLVFDGKGPGDGYRPGTRPLAPQDDREGDPRGDQHRDATGDREAPQKRPQAPTAPLAFPDDAPPLQRFPNSTRTAPTLPPDLLPEPLNTWAHDTAKRASVPVDSFVPGLLVTLAATVGNVWRIKPKQHDPWTVVPNLWGALVQPPGQMKSYVRTATTRFLRDIERSEREAYAQERIAAEVDNELREAQVSALQDEVKSLIRKKASAHELELLRGALIEAKEEARAHRTAQPTLIVNDSTTETLLELLRENPRGILATRDELNGWYMGLQKQGREGDRAFYLEAHDGDGAYSQHRIKRGHIEAPMVTLSMLGNIQPTRLLPMQQGAIGGDDADGLLQRFQVLVWPDKMPAYRLDDRPPAHDLEAQVATVYRALYQLSPQRHGFPDGEPGITRFDPEAQKMFYAWLEQLEHTIRAPETLRKPAWASYLGKTRSLMPTLALLLHLLDLVTGRATGVSVSPEATDRAARLTAYLGGHAAKLYAPELDRDAFTARLLAAKIAEGTVHDGMTVRDIYNAGWSGLGREEVTAGLGYLEQLGWVRLVRVTGDKGGRPREVLQVHPEAQNLADEVTE